MSFDIQFFNEAMEKPESRSFANGVLYYYTHPSGWDKPMEDAIITVENEGNLVAAFVCDGMGGHAGADKAVKRIYESIRTTIENRRPRKATCFFSLTGRTGNRAFNDEGRFGGSDIKERFQSCWQIE